MAMFVWQCLYNLLLYAIYIHYNFFSTSTYSLLFSPEFSQMFSDVVIMILNVFFFLSNVIGLHKQATFIPLLLASALIAQHSGSVIV